MGDNNSGETYEVLPGDTLPSLSLRFDLPISWIKSTNSLFDDFLFPGDKILIVPEKNNQTEPMDAVQTFIDHEHKPRPGKLYLLESHLRFTPENTLKRPVQFDFGRLLLSNVLEVSEELSELHITFLDEDDETVSGVSFQGEPKELTEFEAELSKLSKQIQAETNFEVKKKLIPLPPIGSSTETYYRPKKSTMTELPQLRRRSYSFLTGIKINGSSQVFNDSEVTTVRGALNMKCRNKDWNLVYQLAKDGSSLSTIFSSSSGHKNALLVIETDTCDKIGAFLPDGIKNALRYYGTGESFVFSFTPTFNVYRWSAENESIVSSNLEGLSIGGGGTSAIYVDDRVLNGMSEPCITFESPQLSKKPHFKIVNLEIFCLQ